MKNMRNMGRKYIALFLVLVLLFSLNSLIVLAGGGNNSEFTITFYPGDFTPTGVKAKVDQHWDGNWYVKEIDTNTKAVKLVSDQGNGQGKHNIKIPSPYDIWDGVPEGETFVATSDDAFMGNEAVKNQVELKDTGGSATFKIVGNDPINDSTMVTVRWVDEKGTELYEAEFPMGNIPDGDAYSEISGKENPTKEQDEDNTYEFADWDNITTDADNSNVTYKATYTAHSKHTVTYSWDGLPEGAAEGLPTLPTDNKKYAADEIITVDKSYTSESTVVVGGETYTFSGWDKSGTFEMPDKDDVTIRGTWTKTATSATPIENIKYSYIVKWVDADGNTLKEVFRGSEAVGTAEVSITEADMADIIKDGFIYEFDDGNDKNVLSGTVQEIESPDDIVTLKLVFNGYEDKIGNDPKNSGNTDYSDRIADKYQKTVTYAAVNGTLSEPAKVVVTLKDANGNKAEDGTARLEAEQIPTATANEGYGNGTWTPETPVEGYEITADTDFVITFTQNQNSAPIVPTSTPGTTPTPGPTPITPAAPAVTPAIAPAAAPAAPAAAPTALVTPVADNAVPLANAELNDTDASPQVRELSDEQVPLASGSTASWALLNLILAVFTALISIVLLVGYISKKRNKEGIRVLSLVPSVVSIVVFILTENMSSPMVFVDKWTLWMVVFALANVVLTILSKKKRKDDDDNKQTPDYGIA